MPYEHRTDELQLSYPASGNAKQVKWPDCFAGACVISIGSATSGPSAPLFTTLHISLRPGNAACAAHQSRASNPAGRISS